MSSNKKSKSSRSNIDRQLIQCLARHADDFLLSLWKFSDENSRTMEANITQLSRFTQKDIQREIDSMPPQTKGLMERRGINPTEFLLAYFTIMSRNAYTKTGRYCSSDYNSNQRVIASIYFDTLSYLKMNPASTLSYSTSSTRTWKSVRESTHPPSQRAERSQMSTVSARSTHSTRSTRTTRTNGTAADRQPSVVSLVSSIAQPLAQPSLKRSKTYSPPVEQELAGGSHSIQSSRTQTQNQSATLPIESFAAGASAVNRLDASMERLRKQHGYLGSYARGPDVNDSVSMMQQQQQQQPQQRRSTSSPPADRRSNSNRRERTREPSGLSRKPTQSSTSFRPPTQLSLFSTHTQQRAPSVSNLRPNNNREQPEQRFVQVPSIRENKSTVQTNKDDGNSAITETSESATSSDQPSEVSEVTSEEDDSVELQPSKPFKPSSLTEITQLNNDYSYTM